jgi:WD40 repeat protein
MAFDSTGTRLAVSLRKGTEAGKVVVLSVPDLTVIKEALLDTEPMAVSFSPLGDQFSLSTASSGKPNELRFVVLSTTDWKPLYSGGGLTDSVASVAYDPVGDLLLVGGSSAGEVYRYEVGSWIREDIPPLAGIAEGCRSLAVSKDGRFAAMGTPSAKLYVWPMNDTGPARALGSQEFKGEVTATAFSQDSQTLAAGDSRGEIMVFYRTEDEQWAWKTLFRLPSGGVTGIGFLEDGSLVTTSTYGDIGRWNINAPQSPVETIPLGTAAAESLAFDPRGRWMAVGGDKIRLYPLGAPDMEPVDEFSTAPVTVVESVPPLPNREDVPDFTSSSLTPPPFPDTGTVEPNAELGNFLIWMAPGKEAGNGDNWVQAWAGSIDKGKYNPFQVVIPFETLDAEVMKANLEYLDEVVTESDFSSLYTSAVLLPAQESEPLMIAVGAYRNERIMLSEWIDAIEIAGETAPLLWFLDLQIDPSQSSEEAIGVYNRVVKEIALSSEGLPEGSTPYKRPNIGVGLATLSVEGCFVELWGNLPNALSGMADANSDGFVFDRELLMYLGDHCRAAVRADTIGDAKDEIPVLPPFQIGGN